MIGLDLLGASWRGRAHGGAHGGGARQAAMPGGHLRLRHHGPVAVAVPVAVPIVTQPAPTAFTLPAAVDSGDGDSGDSGEEEDAGADDSADDGDDADQDTNSEDGMLGLDLLGTDNTLTFSDKEAGVVVARPDVVQQLRDQAAKKDAAPAQGGGTTVHAEGFGDIGRLLKSGGRIVSGVWIGTLIATIGLALGWKKHRVAGGLLGAFVVGPIGGGGVGYLLSRGDLKKIEEHNAQRALPGPLKVGDKIRGFGIMVGTPKQDGVISEINYAGSPSQVFVKWADGSMSIAQVDKLERV